MDLNLHNVVVEALWGMWTLLIDSRMVSCGSILEINLQQDQMTLEFQKPVDDPLYLLSWLSHYGMQVQIETTGLR